MNSRQNGHIYFLVMEDPRNAERDFGLVKIGITKGEVLHRAATLQTGNPYDLLRFDSFETPWPREVESFMHRTHATKMQKLEWLQCSRGDLAELVNEARRAAQRINERKSKEQSCNVRVSNGRARRASSAEFQLHRNARRLMKEFVPEKLRLIIARNRLKAATGTTHGIPGIVRVKVVAASTRLDEVAAESKLAELRLEFPDLAAQCLTEKIRGAFRWRGVTRASDFPTECHTARLSEAAANASEANVVQKGSLLGGWTDRPQIWSGGTMTILRPCGTCIASRENWRIFGPISFCCSTNVTPWTGCVVSSDGPY